MTLLSYLYRNGLWISVPLFFVAVALSAYFIVGVIKGVEEAHLFSVPLLEEQEVRFKEAGRVVLCTQGPLLSLRLAKLDYELTGENGLPVKGRTTWFHSKTSGLSWVRMEVKSYRIPMPGRYVLKIGRSCDGL